MPTRPIRDIVRIHCGFGLALGATRTVRLQVNVKNLQGIRSGQIDPEGFHPAQIAVSATAITVGKGIGNRIATNRALLLISVCSTHIHPECHAGLRTKVRDIIRHPVNDAGSRRAHSVVLQLAKCNDIRLIVVKDSSERFGRTGIIAENITDMTLDVVLHHFHLLRES